MSACLEINSQTSLYTCKASGVWRGPALPAAEIAARERFVPADHNRRNRNDRLQFLRNNIRQKRGGEPKRAQLAVVRLVTIVVPMRAIAVVIPAMGRVHRVIGVGIPIVRCFQP